MNYSKAFSSLASFTTKRVGLKSKNGTGGPIFAFLIIALAGCGVDSPDRLRSDIPDGIPAGETVYYNTRWFECAVAIYKLDSVFMDEVRRNGLLSLNKATSAPWAEAPVLGANYAMDRWIAGSLILEVVWTASKTRSCKRSLSEHQPTAAIFKFSLQTRQP